MKNYTQADIDNLISCPKRIVTPPKKEESTINGSYRNNMGLQSIDRQHNFTVFFRKNEDFEDNFTVGLIYIPMDGGDRIILLRCNSRHPHNYSELHHATTHIHIARIENIEKGLRPEAYAETTTQYSTYKEAVLFFCKKCNIINSQEYFKRHTQLPMEFKWDDQNA